MPKLTAKESVKTWPDAPPRGADAPRAVGAVSHLVDGTGVGAAHEARGFPRVRGREQREWTRGPTIEIKLFSSCFCHVFQLLQLYLFGRGFSF